MKEAEVSIVLQGDNGKLLNSLKFLNFPKYIPALHSYDNQEIIWSQKTSNKTALY